MIVCGAGGHVFLCVVRRHEIAGSVRSADVLVIAQKKRSNVLIELPPGDIRTIDLNTRFDVTIAVFALVGYQTTNENLQMALLNAAKHLNEGGLLIIDPWFGPAVIAQKPKHIFVKQGLAAIMRLVRPRFDMFVHTVSVNASVLMLGRYGIGISRRNTYYAVLFPSRA